MHEVLKMTRTADCQTSLKERCKHCETLLSTRSTELSSLVYCQIVQKSPCTSLCLSAPVMTLANVSAQLQGSHGISFRTVNEILSGQSAESAVIHVQTEYVLDYK